MISNPFVALREASLRILGDFKVYDDLMAEARTLPTKPDAKLRVIGAGLPRTGTLSMYAAMHILGYQCYHGLELACKPGLCKKWDEVLEHDLAHGTTEGIDWHKVMDGYEASFDSPASNYWLELSKAFPDAKIVYTHRDGKTWVQSYMDTLRKPMIDNFWYGIGIIWFPVHNQIYKTAVLADKHLVRRCGGIHSEVIANRLEQVRKHIPAERLLVFHPSEGWEPLCQFLRVPIPDVPFPRVNDGPSLAWLLKSMSMIGLSVWILVLAMVWKSMSWLMG